MPHDEAFTLLEAVADEPSFVRFLEAMASDWEGRSPWSHDTLDLFLRGAILWAKDTSPGMLRYSPSTNPWRRCAEIIYAGKSYQ